MATTTKCRRCDRVLRSATSIAAGIGPTCARRHRAAAQIVLERYSNDQVAKVIDLLTTGGVTRIDRHTFRATSSKGAEYVVDTTQATCNCPAGQHGRACYHLAAAQLLAA
jgi:uncharacterized Zn finger protein